MSLICPLCRAALRPGEKSYRCGAGHSFDRAKEGYLSLLHGRQKGEGRGDSKEMILARERVHRAGIFDPLDSELAALRFEKPIRSLLDLGCGEGFFLDRMTRAHAIPISYGLDLSVHAVKLAARTLKQSLILRADLLDALPFADGSLDLVQSIFAPRPLAEIMRVLRPGGYTLLVHPEADHWQEIREFLPLAKIGGDKLPVTQLDGFAVCSDQPITSKRELSHAMLIDLITMSPSIHRLEREQIAWPDLLPPRLSATLSVRVLLLRKG
jgi:23S rRNA (guanine745-N1)-methyltransferase